MNRSQPIDMNSAMTKRLGLTKEALQRADDDRKIVKTETVDDMFPFAERKPCFFTILLRPLRLFRRMKTLLDERRRARQCYRHWHGLLAGYVPWDIRAFLPLFARHLEDYIAIEKKQGMAAPECREHKIATAQEAADIIKRLLADEYDSLRREPVEQKWGKYPYRKITYEDGSVGFEHLTPEGYDLEMHEAYEKAAEDEQADLKRLGELMEQNMLDWWD